MEQIKNQMNHKLHPNNVFTRYNFIFLYIIININENVIFAYICIYININSKVHIKLLLCAVFLEATPMQ